MTSTEERDAAKRRVADATVVGFGGTEPAPTAEAIGDSYAEGLRRCQEEVMGFVVRRLDHDRETAHALAQSRDFAEAVAIQQNWAVRAGTEYVEESWRLAGVFLGAFSPPPGER
jgi:hypothetical protein